MIEATRAALPRLSLSFWSAFSRMLEAQAAPILGQASNPALDPDRVDLLIQYHWPGNVRELQNCIERAVLICDGDAIKGYHLPPTLQKSESASSSKPLSFSTAVENFEKELIIDALKKHNGNQTKTAKHLDTSLRIINYKIHQYGIDPKKYKI